jgi:hypothetical protein
MNQSLTLIQQDLIKLIKEGSFDKEFIFKFLTIYGTPKTAIARLKNGDYNLSKNKDNEIIWKRKVHFIITENEDPHLVIDRLQKSEFTKKNEIRFLIVTDFKIFLAVDVKLDETLDCPLIELSKNSDFFLPLTGTEKFENFNENPADIKATLSIGKLYDQILLDNKHIDIKKNRNNLNIFFTRLIFLYYADDSSIFEKQLFLKNLTNYSTADGKDLDVFFEKLFFSLNNEDKKNIADPFKIFPYVNGDLFSEQIKIPKFSSKTRDIIIKAASLDWKTINPDILGSMLQSVVSPEERDDDEMHYTSVVNILKIISPLFLDDLYEKIQESTNDEKKLKNILKYIYNIKIFDPACGSGNFLIIAYKELCKVEITIFKILKEIYPANWQLSMPGIKLSNFYGIEKSHYATQTARLSLWLAQHQMNLKFKEVFGEIKSILPLAESGNIICQNSINVDWSKFCKFESSNKFIYIIGNPPFKGFKKRNDDQKKDIVKILNQTSKLDYVSLWFIKGAEYLGKIKNSKLAFVTTNSINQGEQVSLLWPKIYKENLEIIFAYRSFKWKNNARNNAVVTVSIIGIGHKSNNKKFLFDGNIKEQVSEINCYLVKGKETLVSGRNMPLSDFPEMTLGSMPRDDSNFILDVNERKKLLQEHPEAEKYLKKFIGGIDFLRGVQRWCLWISDNDLSSAINIPFIKKRLDLVKKSRTTDRSRSQKVHRFSEDRWQDKPALFIPTTTSERREYIPIGYFNKGAVIAAPNQAIYDPPIYLFSILSSRMHMVWIKAVAGRLKTDYRYSNELCYNTFPFPKINNEKIKVLEEKSLNLLTNEREKFTEKTLSELYDPDHMPKSLLECHRDIDSFVEICYQEKPFKSDIERLECLFTMYEQMTKKDQLL